jgi:hypothetical protein
VNEEPNNATVLVNGKTPEEAFKLPTNYEIERVEGQLLAAQRNGEFPAVEIPLSHYFAPGVYIREVFMPAGSFVIGHEHKTEHFNIVLKGVASVMMGGQLGLIKAPFTLISGTGVRKVLYIHEDMIWQTVHTNPDNCQDIPTLEARHVIPTQSFLAHLAEMETLKSLLKAAQPEQA